MYLHTKYYTNGTVYSSVKPRQSQVDKGWTTIMQITMHNLVYSRKSCTLKKFESFAHGFWKPY